MKSISIKLTKTRILFIILTIVCMTAIFFFSSQDATRSSNTSGKVIRLILRIFMNDFSELSASAQKVLVHKAQFIVRKLAHFSIYTTFGFMLSMALGRRRFLTRQTLLALIAGAVYAASDELHQALVPGRSCELRDVMIDTSGVLTGIVISMIIFFIFRIHKKRKGSDQAHS